MSSVTLLALLVLLPADAQPLLAVTRDASRPGGKWTDNWAVSLSTGRSFYDSQPLDAPAGSVWQASHRQSEIRVTHQGTPLVIGVAVHRMAYPAGPDLYAIGAGVVLGAHHPLASWLDAELDATLGLQQPRHYAPMPVVDRPYNPGDAASPFEPGPQAEESGSLELYGRLSAGFALRAASWLDIPIRLTLHMKPVGDSRSLGAALVGLRCLLP